MSVCRHVDLRPCSAFAILAMVLSVITACNADDEAASAQRVGVADQRGSPRVAEPHETIAPPASGVSAESDPRQDAGPTTTATQAVQPCVTLSDSLAAAVETAQLDAADEALRALGIVVDDLRLAAVSAPTDVRSVLEQLAQMYDVFHDSGSTAVAQAAAADSAEVVALTDEMVRLSHGTFFQPSGISIGMTQLEEACPDLSVELDVDELAMLTDPFPRLRDIVNDLADLGHPEIATAYMPPGVLELTARDMSVALSGMEDAYDDCRYDARAAARGDNSGCDALHDACDQRDLLACNDLYWSSVVGSAYEQFGATCGHRAQFGDAGYGGFCDQLN